MATMYPADADPFASPQLTNDLIAGRVNAAGISFAAPSTGYAAPQDDDRTYIAFSLLTGAGPVTVTPGNLSLPQGFCLSSPMPNLEFGGAILDSLVKGIWFVTGTLGESVSIITVRR